MESLPTENVDYIPEKHPLKSTESQNEERLSHDGTESLSPSSENDELRSLSEESSDSDVAVFSYERDYIPGLDCGIKPDANSHGSADFGKYNNSNNIVCASKEKSTEIRTVEERDVQVSADKKRLSISNSLIQDDCEDDVGEEVHESSKSYRTTSVFRTIGRFFKRGSSNDMHQANEVSENTRHNLSPGTKVSFQDGDCMNQWEFKVCGLEDTVRKSNHVVENDRQKRILKVQMPSLDDDSDSEDDSSVITESEDDDTRTQDEAMTGEYDIEAAHKIFFELRDAAKSQCREWRRCFRHYSNVKVDCQMFLAGDLEYDAVIITGNSFGFLDGEPEIQFSRKFGWNLQEKIQGIIQEEYDGELLVGQAIVTALEYEKSCKEVDGNEMAHGVKYAIYAPVMRVPLVVRDSVNAYLAFRAAIIAVKIHNEHQSEKESGMISTVLCPSLCNGFGSMPAGRIAVQMKAAYDAFYLTKSMGVLKPTSLGFMATNHVQMTTKSKTWC